MEIVTCLPRASLGLIQRCLTALIQAPIGRALLIVTLLAVAAFDVAGSADNRSTRARYDIHNCNRFKTYDLQ